MAVLVSGVDGLFLQPPPEVRLSLLARVGAEAEWARAVFGAEAVLPFHSAGPAETTAELLEGSDIGAVLRHHHVDALLLSVGCTPRTRQWAARWRVRLWMTSWADQQRYGDKRRFDAFLRRHGLPCPPRAGLDWRTQQVRALPAVVQLADSLGGEGTFFVRAQSDVARLVRSGAISRTDRLLVRGMLGGIPCGITVFIAPGIVALSAVRRQCYHASDAAHLVFAGIQWLSDASWSPSLRSHLSDVFTRLGELLHARGYFGFANVDFLLDGEDHVHILECNPRLSAATPQLFRHPELGGGLPLAAHFLRPMTGARPAHPSLHGLPHTNFAGATFDLAWPVDARPAILRRVPRNGRYAGATWLGPDLRDPNQPGAFQIIALAQPGERIEPGQSVATVLSSVALYDAGGRPQPHVAAHFAGLWSCDVA